MKEVLNYLKEDIGLLIHIALIAVVTLIIYFSVNHTVRRFIQRQSKKDHFDATNAKFLQRILSTLILMVGFGFVIFLIPSLKHIATTLLAGAGVIVAVIGFSSNGSKTGSPKGDGRDSGRYYVAPYGHPELRELTYHHSQFNHEQRGDHQFQFCGRHLL